MKEICVKKIPCCGCPEMDTCTLEKSESLLKELFIVLLSMHSAPSTLNLLPSLNASCNPGKSLCNVSHQ